MALYEIVLAFDDRQEVRLTDRPPSVGEVLEIGGRSWRVTEEWTPAAGPAARRFFCEPRTLSPLGVSRLLPDSA